MKAVIEIKFRKNTCTQMWLPQMLYIIKICFKFFQMQ